MRIIITGGDGCVGSALKSICQLDEQCIFVNRKDCDLINREQTIELFRKIKPDYVIHLASYVPGFYNIDKVASFSNNVRINENVLEASNAVEVQCGMFVLSVNMFPESPIRFPMDESMIFDGTLTGVFAGYAYSKRMLALQCQNYNSQYNRKYFGIIPCNIYGPNDNIKSGRLIPNLIKNFINASINNSDVVINGTGKPLRQFIYSIDLAKIIKYLVYNYNDTNPIICCDNKEISIAELASYISKILDFKHQIKFDVSKPDGSIKKTITNNYLHTIMPNFLFTPIEVGLETTINNMLTRNF
jgi:GDP-L-fucose synthase